MAVCSEFQLQDFLIVGILLHSTQKASSHVDAVALMAWLIVHPLTEQWLEKLNTLRIFPQHSTVLLRGGLV